MTSYYWLFGAAVASSNRYPHLRLNFELDCFGTQITIILLFYYFYEFIAYGLLDIIIIYTYRYSL